MVRDFFLGKELIDSRTEYKYAMLRAQLGILLGAICFIYIFIDLINGVLVYLPWYIGAIIASSLVIYFNRKRKYLLSSVILLISANMLVFLIATLEDSQGGAFFYFMAGISFVVTPDERAYGVVMTALSLGMYLGGYYYAKSHDKLAQARLDAEEAESE